MMAGPDAVSLSMEGTLPTGVTATFAQTTVPAGGSSTTLTIAAAGSATVVRCLRRKRTPASPAARINRAIRLWLTRSPDSRSSAVILGTP